MSTTSRLSLHETLAYAAPAFTLAPLGIAYYVLLNKFYIDIVGVSAVALGTIILVARVWDALIDPVIGFLSDRTRAALGRRRSWMAWGTVPLILSFIALLNPPEGDATVWVACASFLFFLAWTAITVPYQALGPELELDYDRRTRLLATRDGALVAGTLAAVIIPEVLRGILGLGSTPDDVRQQFFALSLVYGALLAISLVWCIGIVREREWGHEVRSSFSLIEGIRAALANRSFRILLAAYTVGGLGAALPPTLFLFFVEYVLESTKGPLFLVLYFLVGFLFLPLWVLLARKFNKKEVWISAMLVNVGSFAGVLFLGPGDELLYGVIVVLSGIGYGATIALPSSMQGDVIDEDELQTGARREGQFTGFWLVCDKVAKAIGAGVALWVLGFIGFQAGGAQSAEVRSALTWLYAGVPCLCYFIAMAIAWRYPITREEHRRIRAAIDARG